MKPLERKILRGIAREIARLKSLPIISLVDSNAEAAERADRQNARNGLLRIQLRYWLGDLSDTEHKAAQRALVGLHAQGLVRRLACGPSGDRATDVSLTRKGEKIAKTLSAGVTGAKNKPTTKTGATAGKE